MHPAITWNHMCQVRADTFIVDKSWIVQTKKVSLLSLHLWCFYSTLYAGPELSGG